MAIHEWSHVVKFKPVVPSLRIGDLITLVDACMGSAIAYWVVEAVDVKRSVWVDSDSPDYPWVSSFGVKCDYVEGEVLLVNVATIKLGIERVLEPSFNVADRIRSAVASDLAFGELTGELDDECLDVIVQAGLFGEIIYG